ncbi:Hypothetical predicted protein, partial [Pelobates cultripes]
FVVYALKCPCGLLYVGETIRPVKERIGEHKRSIRYLKAEVYRDKRVFSRGDGSSAGRGS